MDTQQRCKEEWVRTKIPYLQVAIGRDTKPVARPAKVLGLSRVKTDNRSIDQSWAASSNIGIHRPIRIVVTERLQ